MYSKYLRNKLVDAALRGGTITFPTTYYVGLLVSEPTANDVVQEIGNTNANGYARQAIAANATNFAATNGAGTTTSPSTGTTAISSNNVAIPFPNPSGGFWAYGSPTNPSDIKYIGLFDALTAGNLWMYIPITPKTIAASDYNPTIPAQALVFTFDA